MTGIPQVSIIVPTWNTRDVLGACLDSIARARGARAVETIVIDNASTDGTAAMVRQRFPSVRLICNAENAGFARATNQGVALSRAPYVLLLNSDAQLLPPTLTAMLELAATQPRAGVVGAQLRNADGSFQASHVPFPTLAGEWLVLSGLGRLLYGRHYPSDGPQDEQGPQPVDWVGGACMLVRRSAFDAVGGLDEGYFMYAEEMDLCYRMHAAGWEVWYQPAAQAVHIGGASSRTRPVEFEANLYRSRVRFFRKHYGRRAAQLLQFEIRCFTAVKIAVHYVVRSLSGGRYGREVIPLRRLARELRKE